MSLLVPGVLPVLPGIALQHRDVDFRWLGAYAAVLNVLTYWIYVRDKRRAKTGGWRVSEVRLHLLELLGAGRLHFWRSENCGTNVPSAATSLCSG